MGKAKGVCVFYWVKSVRDCRYIYLFVALQSSFVKVSPVNRFIPSGTLKVNCIILFYHVCLSSKEVA